VAASAGEASAARDLFAESFELFDRCTAPFEAAVAQVRLATALAAAGEPRAASDELARAVTVFEELGATGERARARALQARLAAPVTRTAGASPVPGAATPVPLSAREREVLHLIADGLGDKQLARRLSLSEHTVHRHVANILRKLTQSSRAAAAAQATRLGYI